MCTQSLYLSTDPNPFLKPSLELTAESHIDEVGRRLRQQHGKACHFAYVDIIQHVSRVSGISLVAIGIMVNPLFLSGVALCVMMTTRASTLTMLASVSSIQQEENAMADIARAIPGLTKLSGMD